MKTLDRYIVRNFLSAAILWFLILMSLRGVIDMFVNMDEFAKAASMRKETFLQLIGDIVNYYGYQSIAYVTELGGVIIVSAATFSLARMNHTNELTAMLASGVSLRRVVAPIVACSMAMGALLSGYFALTTGILVRKSMQMLRRAESALAPVEGD